MSEVKQTGASYCEIFTYIKLFISRLSLAKFPQFSLNDWTRISDNIKLLLCVLHYSGLSNMKSG